MCMIAASLPAAIVSGKVAWITLFPWGQLICGAIFDPLPAYISTIDGLLGLADPPDTLVFLLRIEHVFAGVDAIVTG